MTSDDPTAVDRQRRLKWFDELCAGVHPRLSSLDDGEPASYIPELANVEPDRFGIAVVTVDGQSTAVGDSDHVFTIQSISKLLLYGFALETHGRDEVLRRVGVAPTGDPFNAIELDDAEHRAPNPMVNSGAIAISDMVPGDGFEERCDSVSALFERYLGRRPEIDMSVFSSEDTTGHRNRAIAHLLLDSGVIEGSGRRDARRVLHSVLDLGLGRRPRADRRDHRESRSATDHR